MPSLKITLFGSPRVELDGQNIVIPRRKAMALITYLAITQQPHTRDSLATLFWPEHDQAGARTNLRRMLHMVRKAIGDDWLDISRQQISLPLQENISVDVIHFEESLHAVQAHHPTKEPLCAECVAKLETAVSSATTPFLAGFTLKDAPLFDEWHFFKADGLQQAYGEALQRLIQWHQAQGAYPAAIQHARSWLQLDQLHEPAHRQLIKLYAESDQHSAAIRQYQICVETLQKELWVEPEAETKALFATIQGKQNQPSCPSSAPLQICTTN